MECGSADADVGWMCMVHPVERKYRIGRQGESSSRAALPTAWLLPRLHHSVWLLPPRTRPTAKLCSRWFIGNCTFTALCSRKESSEGAAHLNIRTTLRIASFGLISSLFYKAVQRNTIEHPFCSLITDTTPFICATLPSVLHASFLPFKSTNSATYAMVPLYTIALFA